MIAQFPILAMKNKKIVEQSAKAGCFHCLQIFDVSEINEYTDDNTTVVCPKCKIDSVVGDNCGFVLTEDILKAAKRFWYGKA